MKKLLLVSVLLFLFISTTTNSQSSGYEPKYIEAIEVLKLYGELDIRITALSYSPEINLNEKQLSSLTTLGELYNVVVYCTPFRMNPHRSSNVDMVERYIDQGYTDIGWLNLGNYFENKDEDNIEAYDVSIRSDVEEHVIFVNTTTKKIVHHSYREENSLESKSKSK